VYFVLNQSLKPLICIFSMHSGKLYIMLAGGSIFLFLAVSGLLSSYPAVKWGTLIGDLLPMSILYFMAYKSYTSTRKAE
jgi:hypothetical protein